MTKAVKLLSTVLLLICLLNIEASVAAHHDEEADSTQSPRRSVSDPVSNFLSELGGMFLDVDEVFSKQTDPKVNLEDRIKEDLFGDRRTPLREYLTRIGKNYGNLRKRVGSVISKGTSELLSATDTYKVNIKDKDGKDLFDASLPGIPLRLSTKANLAPRIVEIVADEVSPKMDETHATDEAESIRSEFSKRSGDQKPRSSLTEQEVKEAMESLLQNTQRTSHILGSLGKKAWEDLTNTFTPRRGENGKSRKSEEKKKENEGRNLGDILHTESTNDDYLMYLLNNQAKWFLDNPLLNPKQNVKMPSKGSEIDSEWEQNRDPKASTVVNTASSTEEMEASETGNTSFRETEDSYRASVEEISKRRSPVVSAHYESIRKDGDKREELLDFALKSDSEFVTKDQQKNPFYDEVSTKKASFILAFTPDGVPLKLRFGPEIQNPVKFLHKALRSAGVSLNIPIESFHDLEPAGKEVLQLGAGNGGVITRALYLDLSNSYEMKSLIRTLRVSKGLQKK